jgi:hypothetical protein
LEYEVPAYIADSKYITPNGTKFMDIGQNETVYAIWIGTNDLGNNAFLTDSQVAGTTIPYYIECVYQALDKVYANGGRYFVIMNMAPLQLSPQYATPEHGGLAVTPGYSDKGANITEISYRMWETVVTVNDVFRYKTPFEALISHRYRGAQLAVMDLYGLVSFLPSSFFFSSTPLYYPLVHFMCSLTGKISDIYYNPIEYLDAPANVTGYVRHCPIGGGHCTYQDNPASYLWYDELHPSERAEEVVGKEFVKVVEGTSRWAAYW